MLDLAKEEVTVQIGPYGNRIAATVWGQRDSPRGDILALHGWADNAASFDLLAPALVHSGYSVVAMDFAGHGLSDWTGRYSFVHYARDILAFVRAMQLRLPLFGLAHSYGAECVVHLAAVEHGIFSKLALLDCIGPPLFQAGTKGVPRDQWYTEESKVRIPVIEGVKALCRTVVTPAPRRFDSFDAAVDHRFKVSQAPGRPGFPTLRLSRASTALLMKRGLKQDQDGRYVLRMDPALKVDTSQHGGVLRPHSDVHVGFIREITCAVMWVRTATARAGMEQSHLADAYRSLAIVDIDGEHHAHLEAEHAPGVAQHLIRFYMDTAVASPKL